MLIASWLVLALAAGVIARMLVPVKSGPSTWMQVLLPGVAGCIAGASLRQAFRQSSGLPSPDALSFVFVLLAAVAISAISRRLFRRFRTATPAERAADEERRRAA
jgi:uncharacterized membrane protein YeaQ/YmgE (transglycosylase-associated protein family)